MPSYLLPESEIKREGVAGKEMSAGGAGGPGTVPASAGAGALAEQRKEKTTDIEQGVRRAGPESSSIVLGNGLKIIAIKRGRVPLVSAVYVSEGGLRAENEDTNGLSNLTASLMVKGTDTRSEEEIIPVVERMGGSLAPFSGNNSNGLVMDILKENFPEGLDVFADVLINASFPPEEIEKGKKKIKAMIKEEEKSLFSNGMIHLKRLLYPDHPYGMRRSGSIENVEGFSREEIESFHCERYSPSGGILVITGAIEPSEAIKQAEKRFASWEGPGTEIPDIPVKPLEREKQFALSMDKEQSLLLIGYHGLKLKDPEKYPLEVIASLLSGSNGILFQRLREEQGLVYTSGGTSSPETDRGYFIFYAATDVEGLQKAGEIIDASIKDISEGDFRREDTEASIEWLVTRHAHSLQTNHSLALTVSLDELYGLGALEYKNYPDRIRAVRKDGISSVAEQIFQGSPRAIVVIRSSKER
jgi:zinc protease